MSIIELKPGKTYMIVLPEHVGSERIGNMLTYLRTNAPTNNFLMIVGAGDLSQQTWLDRVRAFVLRRKLAPYNP